MLEDTLYTLKAGGHLRRGIAASVIDDCPVVVLSTVGSGIGGETEKVSIPVDSGRLALPLPEVTILSGWSQTTDGVKGITTVPCGSRTILVRARSWEIELPESWPQLIGTRGRFRVGLDGDKPPFAQAGPHKGPKDQLYELKLRGKLLVFDETNRGGVIEWLDEDAEPVLRQGTVDDAVDHVFNRGMEATLENPRRIYWAMFALRDLDTTRAKQKMDELIEEKCKLGGLAVPDDLYREPEG